MPLEPIQLFLICLILSASDNPARVPLIKHQHLASQDRKFVTLVSREQCQKICYEYEFEAVLRRTSQGRINK